MTGDRQQTVARAGAAVAVAIVLVCAGLMTVDYALARVRHPADDARIAQLQMQARSDAAAARVLEAEQARITRARLARKGRIETLSIVLIAAAVGFVGSVKWRIAQGPRRPAPPPDLLRIRRAPSAPSAAARTGVPISPEAHAQHGVNLAFVDGIVEKEGTGRESAITILQAIQAHYRFLPDDALRRVCELTEITPAQIAGTSSFYARFRRSPLGEHVVRVCHGTACHVSGARQITDELRRQLLIPDGADTDARGQFTIDEVACVGCCSLAPVVMVDEHTAGRLTPETARAALDVVASRAAHD